MDRRHFLAGSLGIAGWALLSTNAQAAPTSRNRRVRAAVTLPSTPDLFPPGTTRFGIFEPGAPWNLDRLRSQEQLIGRTADLVHWFHDWGSSSSSVLATGLAAVDARGSTPMVTWEPWDWERPDDRTTHGLSTIASGKHDAYITSWARAIAEFAKPVVIRFAPEMNSPSAPWSTVVAGGDVFRAAWARIVGIFRSNGGTNAMWHWCPSIHYEGCHPLSDCYPGDGLVDIVGLDAYNAGDVLPWGGWTEFHELFSPSLAVVRSFTAKPLVVGEVGCVEQGGNKASWVASMAANAAVMDVRGIVWFNEHKEANWRIDSSTVATESFRTILATERFAAV